MKSFVLVRLMRTGGQSGCDVVIGNALYKSEVIAASYVADELFEKADQVINDPLDYAMVISIELLNAINQEIKKIN